MSNPMDDFFGRFASHPLGWLLLLVTAPVWMPLAMLWFLVHLVSRGMQSYKDESISSEQSEPTKKEPVKIKQLRLVDSGRTLVEIDPLQGREPDRFKKIKLSKSASDSEPPKKIIDHQTQTRLDKFMGAWKIISEKDRVPSLLIWDDGKFMIREFDGNEGYRGTGSYKISGYKISLMYDELVLSGPKLLDDYGDPLTNKLILGK